MRRPQAHQPEPSFVSIGVLQAQNAAVEEFEPETLAQLDEPSSSPDAASPSQEDESPEVDPAADAQREDNLPQLEPAQPEEGLPSQPDANEPDLTQPSNPTVPDASTPPDTVPPQPAPSVVPAPGVNDVEPSVSTPDYLDPNPNPLQRPTQPEEVEIVGTQPITLEQALELAQRNSTQLRDAQLQLELAEGQLREVEASRLPNVAASSNLNFQENTNQSSGINSDLEDLLGGQQNSNQDEIIASLGGTLQINYDLFTSGRRPALIRAAEGRIRFQQLQVEAIAEQLQLDVATDYYDLQEAGEQVRIARVALEEAERSLRDAEALERAGVGTRFDVLTAQVDVANSRQNLTQSLSNQQIARRQLARQLNLASSVDIATADPVAVAEIWDLSLEESIVLALRNRAELEQQLVQRDIGDEQRRAARAELGPQVSLFAQYDLQGTLNNDNQDFRGAYSFGAQVSMSLFDGGAARARADQEETNIAIAENQFDDASNQIRLEVEQSFSDLQANYLNINTANIAVDQAEEALRLARLRFQAGVGTQTEVLEAQTDLTNAQLNQVQAILGYNRSLVSLRRAISNFPGSTLAGAPQAGTGLNRSSSGLR
ncbi:TolC family protein [Oculatella sp. LEGE 06141]|nr:TolC family protein [Oculatella sp. LEGE 06141]